MASDSWETIDPSGEAMDKPEQIRLPDKILQYQGHIIKQYKLDDDETFYTWEKPDRSIEGILRYDNVGMIKTADKLEAIFHRLREKEHMLNLPSNNEDISHLLFKTTYRKEENFEYSGSANVQIKYKLDFNKPPLKRHKGNVLKQTIAAMAAFALPLGGVLGTLVYSGFTADAVPYVKYMMSAVGGIAGGCAGALAGVAFSTIHQDWMVHVKIMQTDRILEEAIKNEQKLEKLLGRHFSNAKHHYTKREFKKEKKLEKKQNEIFQRLTESFKLGCVSISRKESVASAYNMSENMSSMKDTEKNLIEYFNELRGEITPKEAELILRARPKKKYDAVVNKVVEGFKEKEKEEYWEMLANKDNNDVLNESQEKAREEYNERLVSTGKKKRKRRKYKTLLETKGLNPDQIKEQYDDAWADFDKEIGAKNKLGLKIFGAQETNTLEEITLAKDWKKDEKYGELIDGRYELKEKIGEGALGRLYKARDIRNDHEVVVKFEKEELGKDTIQKRKDLHLKLMRLEKHENVIPELDANLYCSPAYIVNSFIEGADLKKILDSIRELNEDQEEEQFLSMENIISISRELAKALAFLHKNRITHYDVKPENMIVDMKGKTHLGDCDLGEVQKEKMASVLASMASVDNGKQIGTPNYMSPQMRGIEPGPVDERADIYSLGVTLGEIVSNEAIPRAGMLEKRDDVMKSFKNIIAKCQEPKLKRRYQTMQEVLDDLKKISIKSKPLQLRIIDAEPVEKATVQEPEQEKTIEPPVTEPVLEEHQTEEPAETMPFVTHIQEETEEMDEIDESSDGRMLEGFA